jgi:hypothetical protein
MHYRLLVGVIFCLGCFNVTKVCANSSKLVGTKVEFDHYTITAPFKVSSPVIAVELATNEQPPMDELVLIGIDKVKQTWLAVYMFDVSKNGYVLLDKIQLSDEYFAYDVSDNNEGLYFLAKDEVVSLRYIDPVHTDKSINENHKVPTGLYLQHKQDIKSIYLLNKSNFLANKDFIQDINKDGIDDIILPDFEQTNLWIFSKDNQLLTPQHLNINAQVAFIREGINFTPRAIFFADFNQDQQQDIAWISKGNINYFSQNPDGTFSNKAEHLPLADTIHGLNWWQITESDGESPDQSNLTHRVVEEIKDINGDGVADIIVRFTQSSGVLERANDYEFYFGYINENKRLTFKKTPNTVIKAEGTLTGLNIVDVNDDNKFEVLLSSFELSVSNIIGALLSGGIDQNVLLFALNDDDEYETDALISKEVELSFSLTSGQSGEPIVLLSDVNGDKRQDLILSSGEEKLTIFLGNNSSRLFNRKGSKYKMLLPKNGALFEQHDINHDGKADFIMRYGRLDEESMASKVTILMVQ